MDDDGWIFYGHGSTHDLSAASEDPRNPRLAGLRSVSYAAACAMKRRPPEPATNPIGFHRASSAGKRTSRTG
jgi:hypothetical protein